MRTRPVRALPVLLALGCGLAAASAQAQTRPFLGLSAGVGGAPAALQDYCGAPSTLAGVEARAGLDRGAFTAEARIGVQSSTSTVVCIMDELVRTDGVHTVEYHPFSGGHISTADLRLRYRPLARTGLALHAGAGWLPSHELPYLVAGAGLRSRGARPPGAGG